MSNLMIIYFMREHSDTAGISVPSDAVLKITLHKKSFAIHYTDPTLSRDDQFTLYSVEKLVDYINMTMKMIKMDAKGEYNFKSVQLSIPRYPDIILHNDTNIVVNVKKLTDAIRSVAAFK